MIRRTTEDQALIEALRNLWPILDKASRAKTLDIVKTIQGKKR